MTNQITPKLQRICMLITSICFAIMSIKLCLTNTQAYYLSQKNIHHWSILGTIMVSILAGIGYNLISNDYYFQQGYKIKWKLGFLGLKVVNWSNYDFHFTPVITFTHVIHSTRLAWDNVISLEWGFWAFSVHRMKIKKLID